MATIKELKQEASELGITYNQNIGAEKLAAKIEDHYKSQETSGTELLEAIAAQEAKEKSEEKSAVKGKAATSTVPNHILIANAAEARARTTRVITITDNDVRENNQTTVAIANCSNMYFDLGTVYIPLNMPVEVKQGHIDTLLGVEIPLHGKDPKSGLSTLRMRSRYSISYEDMK